MSSNDLSYRDLAAVCQLIVERERQLRRAGVSDLTALSVAQADMAECLDMSLRDLLNWMDEQWRIEQMDNIVFEAMDSDQFSGGQSESQLSRMIIELKTGLRPMRVGDARRATFDSREDAKYAQSTIGKIAEDLGWRDTNGVAMYKTHIRRTQAGKFELQVLYSGRPNFRGRRDKKALERR